MILFFFFVYLSVYAPKSALHARITQLNFMLFFFNNRFFCFCLSYTHTFIYFFKFAHSLFYSFALCQTISSLAISVSCRRFVLFYDFCYSKWFCRAWKYFVFVFSQYFRFLFSRNLDFFLKIFLLQTHFHCRFDSVILFTAISFAAFIVVSCWVRFFFFQFHRFHIWMPIA